MDAMRATQWDVGAHEAVVVVQARRMADKDLTEDNGFLGWKKVILTPTLSNICASKCVWGHHLAVRTFVIRY